MAYLSKKRAEREKEGGSTAIIEKLQEDERQAKRLRRQEEEDQALLKKFRRQADKMEVEGQEDEEEDEEEQEEEEEMQYGLMVPAVANVAEAMRTLACTPADLNVNKSKKVDNGVLVICTDMATRERIAAQAPGGTSLQRIDVRGMHASLKIDKIIIFDDKERPGTLKEQDVRDTFPNAAEIIMKQDMAIVKAVGARAKVVNAYVKIKDNYLKAIIESPHSFIIVFKTTGGAYNANSSGIKTCLQRALRAKGQNMDIGTLTTQYIDPTDKATSRMVAVSVPSEMIKEVILDLKVVTIKREVCDIGRCKWEA